ncbi:MAG: response regulator [Candidatus Pristimantibacillus lignocellulolyticus]|uniref:Response regulator n=1 Tax=Candidatus Pristimantibacillus lignocellulolyticus TaxID=2994561 RepID=A0A9J6ZHY8_9BACL|nr:MAG: response regulator [Candidatus Pristimantibacillus lignocellulolyticus]
MYNVLLVDDDELDLEGMKRFIPWSELGMEVKGSVNNALSACEVLDQHAIDILVSDVNMPYMSGLELARIALQRKPNIRIIFVSGFQEFSYVQQALSLKAYSYVLKPMEDRELIASLMKVKRDLDEDLKYREVEEAYQDMIPIAKSDMLLRLFEGEDTTDREFMNKLMKTHELHRLNWPIRVAVMELDLLSRVDNNAGSRLEGFKILLNQLHEAANRGDVVPYCKLSPQRIALLLEANGIEDKIAQLIDFAQRKQFVTITTGLGLPVHASDQLYESYQQAIQAVEGKMFFGKGGIIHFEEVSIQPAMLDYRLLDKHMNALMKVLKDYELVQIYDELDNLFCVVTNLRSKFTVHNLTSYMIWKLDHYLSSMDEDLFELLDIDIRKLDILLQFETINDIRKWMLTHIFQISEKLHQKNSTNDSKFIHNVTKVIKERMSENITVKDIAQHFSFSSSYFGFLVREKSGHTFNELLVQLRMEKACELLKLPGLKIYEISDQVGYRYLPYFSRQFKEKFGVTPLEYRKKEK